MDRIKLIWRVKRLTQIMLMLLLLLNVVGCYEMGYALGTATQIGTNLIYK